MVPGISVNTSVIEELIVIAGDMVLFNVRHCEVRYFDDHYHAYGIDITSQKSLVINILDRNVYHCHVMSNSFRYISLKYSLMYMSSCWKLNSDLL